MSIKKIMITSVALLALGLGASIAEAKKAPAAPKDPNAVSAPKTPNDRTAGIRQVIPGIDKRLIDKGTSVRL